MESVIVALWVALSVFVVWCWAAKSVARWWGSRTETGPQSQEDAMLAQRTIDLASAWEAVNSIPDAPPS